MTRAQKQKESSRSFIILKKDAMMYHVIVIFAFR